MDGPALVLVNGNGDELLREEVRLTGGRLGGAVDSYTTSHNLEVVYLAALPSATHLRVDGQSLALLAADGTSSPPPFPLARRPEPHFTSWHRGADGYHVPMSSVKAWIERRRWHKEPRSQGRLRAPDAPPDHEEPPARPLQAFLPSSNR